VLKDENGGFERALEATNDGRFRFAFLPPGNYQLVIEQLGYRPVRIVELLVPAGGEVEVRAVIRVAEPPVDSVETIPASGVVSSPAWGGAGEGFSGLEPRRAPDTFRDLAQLGRFTSVSDQSLGIEGLPGWMSGIFIDGVPFAPASHAALPSVNQPAAAFS